jgi:hypothetical protein
MIDRIALWNLESEDGKTNEYAASPYFAARQPKESCLYTNISAPPALIALSAS